MQNQHEIRWSKSRVAMLAHMNVKHKASENSGTKES